MALAIDRHHERLELQVETAFAPPRLGGSRASLLFPHAAIWIPSTLQTHGH